MGTWRSGSVVLSVWLLLWGSASSGHPLAGQEAASPHTLLPPQVGLLPLPLPRLDSLEIAVRRQIADLQGALSDRLANPEGLSNQEMAEIYGSLGQLYQAYELADPAEAAYLNAIRLQAEDFQWVYLLGMLYDKAGRLPEARLYLEESRRLRPDYLAAAVHLGGIYLQMNQSASARAEYQKALEMDSGATAAHVGLGEVALAEEQFDQARQHFETALKQVPEANRIHYSLAMAYRGLGDMEKARAHLEQRGTVGVRPSDPLMDSLKAHLQGERVYLLQGRLAYQAGRFREAAQAFQKAVDSAPQSAGARLNLGSALARTGDAEGAIQQYRSALQIEPMHATAHFNLGALLAQKGQALEALAHYQQALSAMPEDPEVNLETARLLIDFNRLKEALPLAEKARSLDPSNEMGFILAADILARQQRYRQALGLLEDSMQADPKRGRTAHALARLLAASPDASMRDGERALKLAMSVYQAQNTVSHARTVAYALAEAGRCDEAAEWQQQLFEAVSKSNDQRLAAELQTDLKRYQDGPPCRPPDSQGMTPQAPANPEPDQGNLR